MNIRLIVPSQNNKEQALAFKREFIENNEPIINGSELFDQIDCYEDWLSMIHANAKEKTVNPNWVVTDTYFAVDEKDSIVGVIDLRHTLKGFLVDFGNCGYSVRPSERKKGYATEMLRILLKRAKEIGLTEIILSAKESNVASIKSIVKNGGVKIRSFEYEGEQADVYQIKF